ncbi:MAG TPA: MBOAT family O-acyltransferase [Acidimicrobiia bacterium]|nr:MBOAT family O-acyltransferase [Acidimicrobiia bacterium]
MLFPTIQFAIFFVIVLTANWLLLPHRRQWKLFMLGASWFFYGSWDWRFVFLLVASTVLNQAAARLMERSRDERSRRLALVGAVAANLGIIAWFKYYGFFVSSVINFFRTFGIELPLPLLEITLPVGISFFTFQALSYVIDVYRRREEPSTLLDFAVYLAFFPQLVAGPIVRSSEFIPQMYTRKDPRRVDAAGGFSLIVGGLFKKVVVANTLAGAIVDPMFASPAQFSALEVLVGVYGYAVQIYADFSGYTDIAIGVATLMGFKFPDNFDNPYSALSIQDFWRRWHMTLSRWLRDYLYIPLGGNRGTRVGTYRNLMLTMLLGGLWHGAAWTFVIWGGYHGALLAWERWRTETGRAVDADTPGRRAVKRLATFHLVCLGWILFRADSMGRVGEILSRLLDWGPAPAVTPAVLTLVVAGIGVQFIPSDFRVSLVNSFSRLRPAAMTAALAGSLLLLDGLGPEGVAPFIYFQF